MPIVMNPPTYPVICADCGKPIDRPEGTAVGTGYATVPGPSGKLWDGNEVANDVRYVCYPCADVRERNDLAALKPGEAFGAYLAADGKHLTTWTGGVLARITSETTSRTGFHGTKLTHIQAVTPDGKRLHGKGSGRSMFIRIRAAKEPVTRTSREA